MSEPQTYVRKLLKMRGKERQKDQFTGGYVLCDCSWLPQFSIQALKIYRRPSKKRSNHFSTFASCDRCGLVKRLHGEGWTHGTPPVFALSEDQIKIVMRAVEGFKQSFKQSEVFGGSNV